MAVHLFLQVSAMIPPVCMRVSILCYCYFVLFLTTPLLGPVQLLLGHIKLFISVSSWPLPKLIFNAAGSFNAAGTYEVNCFSGKTTHKLSEAENTRVSYRIYSLIEQALCSFNY